MAYSRVTYTGDGSARSFSIPFLFLDRTHVTDYLDGIVKADDLQVQKYIDECLAVKLKYPKV